MSKRVGFMQGRLSPLVKGRIQAFPWEHWREEFPAAERLGLPLMEWTLDQEGIRDNPLLSEEGRREIRALCDHHAVSIPSLTGDCFMQAPFWKVGPEERAGLTADFTDVARACSEMEISIIVLPLVDNGRLDCPEQEEALVDFLEEQAGILADLGVTIAFESDFEAADLARFIGRFDPHGFGINYDTGNSAAQGFDPALEIGTYGHRIVNVHVKDRLLGGTTVPLGAGNADFASVFGALRYAGYEGNFVLQTARAEDGDHAGVLGRFRQMTLDWLSPDGA